MKKFVLIASALVFGFVAMAQSKSDDVVKFNTEKHDFGKIKQNVPVTYYFEIKNTSDKPIVIENASASCGCTVPEKPQLAEAFSITIGLSLVIENASASCGCTVPEKPEKPINPGATGKVKVQYNAAAKH